MRSSVLSSLTAALFLAAASSFIFSHAAEIKYPDWYTSQRLPAAPINPKPSLNISLVVYGGAQSICPSPSSSTSSSSSSYTYKTWCSHQTPTINPSDYTPDTCILFVAAPPLPSSNASTGLAYKFDQFWNLGIFNVPFSGTPTCTSQNLLINITNPQWNYASSCSKTNLTTFYQFGYQNGVDPVTNGSMTVIASGMGYGPCPYGYFWPIQSQCSKQQQPTVDATATSTLPLIPVALGGPTTNNPLSPTNTSFALNKCTQVTNSSGVMTDVPASAYSMQLTVGVYNRCTPGCDGANFRTCVAAINVCLINAKASDKQCTCFNDGLDLCAAISQRCTDPFTKFTMNDMYLQAQAVCKQANMQATLFTQIVQTVCADCGPATAFAVIFALMFGCLSVYFMYYLYHIKTLIPHAIMRTEAMAHQ